MQPDGSGLERVATGNELHRPSWSPDGQRLLFHQGGGMDSGIEGASIWAVDAQGGERTELIGGGTYNRFPDWSPDGRFFVFSRGEVQAGGDYDGGDDLFVADAAGDRLFRLTRSPGVEWEPAWSPDGLTIAYIRFVQGNPDLYTLGLRDGATTRLTSTPALETSPQWAPDGSMIAFIREYRDRDLRPQVVIIQPDGTDERAVFTCEDECQQLLSVAWSPDGKRLVVAASVSGGGYQGELYVMSSDGRNARRLTHGATAGQGLSWQPLPE